MAPVVSRVYSTRHRVRAADKEARYDDIFSAVNRAVQDEDVFGGLSRRLIEENSMAVRMRLFSHSSQSSSDEEGSERGLNHCLTSSSSRPQRRSAVAARSALIEGEEQVDTVYEQRPRIEPRKMMKKIVIVERKSRENSTGKVPEEGEGMPPQRFTCALCPLSFDRHLQLHKHIMETHPATSCPSCKQPWRVLRQRHECFKCPHFAPNLERHLIEKHYAVSSRRGALLECSRCSRSFEHLKEVLHHEKIVHGLLHKVGPAAAAAASRRAVMDSAKRQIYHCRACGDAFGSRYLRDQHLTKHFQSVIESVWLTIDQMQETQPERYLMNQCPLCGFVMSSRKSFRTHIIHRHLMYDGTALEALVGPGVKQDELLTVREHIALEGRRNNSDPVALPQIVIATSSATVKEEQFTEEDKRADSLL